MEMKRKALGRGLEALLEPEEERATAAPSLLWLPLEVIRTGEHQPRRRFEEESLEDLAESIRARGLLQPLLVRRHPLGGYELVAGERRLRAAARAGLEKVPALLVEAEGGESLVLALIENVQRADLSPIEEALAYRHLTETLGLTQEEVAERVGKDRATIANLLRLLKLPQPIQDAIAAGELTAGHARALLALPAAGAQIEAWRAVRDGGLSVRETERLVGRMARRKEKRLTGKPRDLFLLAAEDILRRSLATKVRIRGSARRGTIELAYFSQEELEGLLARLGGGPPPRGAAEGGKRV